MKPSFTTEQFFLLRLFIIIVIIIINIIITYNSFIITVCIINFH